jgi:hypothetical protein
MSTNPSVTLSGAKGLFPRQRFLVAEFILSPIEGILRVRLELEILCMFLMARLDNQGHRYVVYQT